LNLKVETLKSMLVIKSIPNTRKLRRIPEDIYKLKPWKNNSISHLQVIRVESENMHTN